MRPRMDNYPNEIPGFRAPRQPQLQFSGMHYSQVRSSDAHDGSNAGLLDAFIDPQLHETNEQSLVVDSYDNEGYGSQSSTDHCAEQSPYIPRTDYTQGYRQWSPSTTQNYIVGMAQENEVVQTSEDSGSIRSTLQHQGNHMVGTSAPGLGDARYHSSTQAPETGFDQREAATTDYWDSSLFSFDGPSGNGRSLATTRAHINPNVSHNGRASNQDVSHFSLASLFQSETSSAMQSLDEHGFARNPHGPPQGNTETHLYPTWQLTQRTSSNLHYDDRSNLSDNEVCQPPSITTRRPKRKCPSDPPSPTTPPPGTKRRKRKFTLEERAQIRETRRAGACQDCRNAKRKVCGRLQMSLYRCPQAYRSYSACIHLLGMALPWNISHCRPNPLPDLLLASLRNEPHKSDPRNLILCVRYPDMEMSYGARRTRR